MRIRKPIEVKFEALVPFRISSEIMAYVQDQGGYILTQTHIHEPGGESSSVKFIIGSVKFTYKIPADRADGINGIIGIIQKHGGTVEPAGASDKKGD
jgi:hypothetical protein